MTAVGNEAQITEALLTRLIALTLSPVVPVAFLNVQYPATGSDKPDTYLEARILRAPTQGIGVSAWNEHVGILQVDVVYKPQDGEIKPLQIADSVAAWFPRGTRMTNGSVQVDVYEPAQIATAISDGDRLRIPVSIRYRTFTR